MSDKVVQLPDGKVVSFPDTMSDANIALAIKQNLGGAPHQETFGETFQHPYSSLAAKLPDSTPPWLKTGANVVARALDFPLSKASTIPRGAGGETSR